MFHPELYLLADAFKKYEPNNLDIFDKAGVFTACTFPHAPAGAFYTNAKKERTVGENDYIITLLLFCTHIHNAIQYNIKFDDYTFSIPWLNDYSKEFHKRFFKGEINDR